MSAEWKQEFPSMEPHLPKCNVINLDYPLYGTTVVVCDGVAFDLEVVRKALALAAELGGELEDGNHRSHRGRGQADRDA